MRFGITDATSRNSGTQPGEAGSTPNLIGNRVGGPAVARTAHESARRLSRETAERLRHLARIAEPRQGDNLAQTHRSGCDKVLRTVHPLAQDELVGRHPE